MNNSEILLDGYVDSPVGSLNPRAAIETPDEVSWREMLVDPQFAEERARKIRDMNARVEREDLFSVTATRVKNIL